MGNKLRTTTTTTTTTTNSNIKEDSRNDALSRRGNIDLIQNVLLIWLDLNIDETNPDCRNTLSHLRRVINTINTYTNTHECLEFLRQLDDEKVCVVVSGSLGQEIVPRIHQMTQVDSIVIFCRDEQQHKKWAKDWPKIKGVFTRIESICATLKQAARQCERDAMPMSFITNDADTLTKSFDQLDSSFMYTQIFKEILLTIQFQKEHFQEFIALCRQKFADNPDELKNIKSLEKTYPKKTPIWWYTCECFLYPMLNRALRTMDIDVIIKMGFYIGDLHRHIEQLHSKQFVIPKSTEKFLVYRGQGMSKIDFNQMRKSKGGLMSFNNFLSTSKNKEVSLSFANHSLTNPDTTGILFVMTIDPSKSTTPFASIAEMSDLPNEDEVLFSTNTVFRVHDIKPMDKTGRLFQVDLILTCNNDKDISALIKYMQEETKGPSGWYRLGELLRKLGQFEKAQVIFIAMLNKGVDDHEKGAIFNELGLIKDFQGEHKEAIIMFEKSLEIQTRVYSSAHQHLAWPYNNLALVYQHLQQYAKALFYHSKALEIRQHSLPSDHPDLACSYNNIGILYAQIKEYDNALAHFAKAHEIKLRRLPGNHPDIAYSYDNIGSVYAHNGEYSKALAYHEKAHEIFQRILPAHHCDLAFSYNNLGVVYENLGPISKARMYYERAIDIGRRLLPSNHSGYLLWQKNLENIKRKL